MEEPWCRFRREARERYTGVVDGHVESRMGAVAWGRLATLRFPSPLIKPDGRPASGFTMEHTDKKTGCERILCSTFPLLHSLIQRPRTVPVVDGVTRLIANHRDLLW